jgi:hypothetical protein
MARLTAAGTCPLCDAPPKDMRRDPSGRDAIHVECERCGRFTISDTVTLTGLEPAQKPLLAAYCRRLPQEAEPPRITSATIQQFIYAVPKYTPLEKLDNLLAIMGRMSAGLGKYTTFDSKKDYPLLVAENSDEAEFLLRELHKREYTDGNMDGTFLTLRGWERLPEVQRGGRLSNRAFVAMSFEEGLKPLYENAIEPAIRESGYDPLRMDRHEHVNRIDDEIIAQIKRSRFMVADFTRQRYGVYFESGMMMGLGRTVIWLSDKRELDEGKLHFDIRQFNFIAYESLEDAKTRLYNRILAVEGEGPGQFEKPG